MQKNIKRILSLVLVIVLCFSAVPLSAFATEDSLEGPYEVVEAEEMPSVEPDEHEEVPPGDEVSEEPSVEPETFPEESDPYEVEGTEIDAAKIWPTPMRRAAMAASVGSSSVLKIGNDADINKAAPYAYNPSSFKSYYEEIKKKLNDFLKIPSFASKEASNAETITLRWDGSKYSATVTDSNGVLKNYPFTGSISDVKIESNGNQLKLSTSSPITSPITSSRVYSRSAAVGGKGAVAVWRTSDSSQQDFATYNAAGGEPVGCYIKVKTDAVGNAGIVKTAEDGKVEGLQFQITGSDGSSTTKTTDANGNIDIDGLPIYAADGSKITYTATEVNVPNKYVKPESQTFQLSEGQTASLQFDNKLKRWRVTVTKVDSATGSTAQGNGSLAGAKYPVRWSLS